MKKSRWIFCYISIQNHVKNRFPMSLSKWFFVQNWGLHNWLILWGTRILMGIVWESRVSGRSKSRRPSSVSRTRCHSSRLRVFVKYPIYCGNRAPCGGRLLFVFLLVQWLWLLSHRSSTHFILEITGNFAWNSRVSTKLRTDLSLNNTDGGFKIYNSIFQNRKILNNKSSQ